MARCRARAFPRRPCLWVILVLLPGLSSYASAGEIATGNFTKITSTTTQTVSHGLSVTPKAMIFFTGHTTSESATTDLYFSLGFTDGTDEYSISGAAEDAAGTTDSSSRVASKAITIVEWGETTLAEADLTTWDSSDFTLDWTTNDANASVIHFIAIGGTDVSANAITWTAQGSTGNQAVTGVGFEPTVVFHMYSFGLSAGSTTSNMDFSYGVMEAAGGEWGNSTVSIDNQGTSIAGRSQLSSACLFDVVSAGTTSSEASFVSMDSNGFTVNWSKAGSSPTYSLALSGVNAHAGVFTKSSSTSVPVAQAVTGVEFEPEALMFSSAQNVVDTNGTTNARRGFGATDGTAEGSVAGTDEHSIGTSSTDRVGKTSKVFVKMNNNSRTIDAEADFSSFDSDGFTLSWTTNDAVATEIAYLALVPFSAVRVRMSALEAVPHGSGVGIRWRSEIELDNLGYTVLREDGAGARVRVNDSPTLGSGILATPGTATASAQQYSLFDPAGQVGDRYWVQDQDLDGSTRLHGPVEARPTRVSPRALSLSHPVRPAASASTVASVTPAVPRFAQSTPGSPEVASNLAAREGLWVLVSEEGWVEVEYEDWAQAGLPSVVDASRLQLHHRGIEHAIEVVGDADGSFEPGDSVRFYGLGVDSIETGRAAYLLSTGTSPGRRISRATSGTLGPSVSTVLYSVQDAEDVHYFAALRNGEADNFFGGLVSQASLTRTITTPDYDVSAGCQSTLRVALQGIGTRPHRVSIAVNGTNLGVQQFMATDSIEREYVLPRSVGGPTLDVVLTATNADDFSFLDSLVVTYPRRLRIDDAILRGSAPGSSLLSLETAAPGVRLFDVTHPESVTELTTFSSPGSGGSTTRITAALPGGSERTWLAVPPGSTALPEAMRVNLPSQWRRFAQGAEFVVIAPEAWRTTVQPLVTLRQQEGLTTVVVAVEDIYDEWNDGIEGSAPILEFLRDASLRWSQPPRYLLLVGDATYDPRQRLSGTAPTVIPTRLIDSGVLETASDHWFGDLDQDGTAEVAVGRLPFSAKNELESYVDKAIVFGSRSTRGGQPSRALVVSDDDDTFPFGQTGKQATTLFPASIEVRHLDRNSLPAGVVRQRIQAALEQELDIVAYFGHGGTGGWGAEDLLTTAQVGSRNRLARSPIVFSASCLNGFFHHRTTETLGESWLAGDAIAVLSSSALTNPYSQRELTLAIMTELLSAPAPTRLGDAILAARTTGTPTVRRTTVLLGDPTLLFRR